MTQPPGQADQLAGPVRAVYGAARDAARGYRLAGEIRSSAVCGRFSRIDAAARDLSREFARAVPAEWTLPVALDKR